MLLQEKPEVMSHVSRELPQELVFAAFEQCWQNIKKNFQILKILEFRNFSWGECTVSGVEDKDVCEVMIWIDSVDYMWSDSFPLQPSSWTDVCF